MYSEFIEFYNSYFEDIEAMYLISSDFQSINFALYITIAFKILGVKERRLSTNMCEEKIR